MLRRHIEKDGKTFKALLLRKRSEVWLHVDGKTYVFENKKQVKAGKSGANSNKGLILAPMPGKILKVNAKVGDAVKANQTLVIMEAMKMEYSLVSGIDGVVNELRCKEGDQVGLGQNLAEVK